MADQKEFKKRLKVLMLRPENQICSDCPEKKPTWASLIVPPPGAPPGTQPLGAFCCLECSGSHRRLGVHISFVRSINLDSWTEKHVQAMENGGNAKVNAIFEAKLAGSGKTKPSHLADGPTRERFIRDKYERRKYYDPAAFANADAMAAAVNYQHAHPSAPASGPVSGLKGTPSDVARQRVANRQARMTEGGAGGGGTYNYNYNTTTNSYSTATTTPTNNSRNNTTTTNSRPTIAPAPVSAPVMLDLLDFGAGEWSDPTPSPAPAVPVHDPFAVSAPAFQPTTRTTTSPAVIHDPFAVTTTTTTTTTPMASLTTTTTTNIVDPFAPSPMSPLAVYNHATTTTTAVAAPAPTPIMNPPNTSNESIMALFSSPPPRTSFTGGVGAGQMGMMGMGGMTQPPNKPQQQQQQPHAPQQQRPMMMANNHNFNYNHSHNMNPMQVQMQHMQQQQQMMMMKNMMGTNYNTYNQQQPLQPSNMTMMGGTMMNMQQPQQPPPHNMMMMMGGTANTNNSNNFNMMMQGMQTMSMGNPQQPQHQPQFATIQTTNSSDDGGFGTPMGGTASNNKDPFSSLGGMNAFR